MNDNISKLEKANKTLSQYIKENKKNGILKIINDNTQKISLLDIKYNHYENIYHYCHRKDKPFSNKVFFNFIQNHAKEEIYSILRKISKTDPEKILYLKKYDINKKIEPKIKNNTSIHLYLELNSKSSISKQDIRDELFINIESIQTYIELGFNIKQTFNYNNNIAHLFFQNTKEIITQEAIDILLKSKIDLLQVNDYGLTPLHYLIDLTNNTFQKRRGWSLNTIIIFTIITSQVHVSTNAHINQ